MYPLLKVYRVLYRYTLMIELYDRGIGVEASIMSTYATMFTFIVQCAKFSRGLITYFRSYGL